MVRRSAARDMRSQIRAAFLFAGEKAFIFRGCPEHCITCTDMKTSDSCSWMFCEKTEIWKTGCCRQTRRLVRKCFFDRCGPGQYLLQILNYSGYNGTTFSKPLPVEVTVTLKNIQVEKVQLLTGGGRKKLSDQARFRLKVQGLYQAVLVTGKEEV